MSKKRLTDDQLAALIKAAWDKGEWAVWRALLELAERRQKCDKMAIPETGKMRET